MILTAAKILSFERDLPIIDHGSVVIQGEKILALGPAEQIRKRFPAHRSVILEGAVLLPGLVNCHAHLELPPLLDLIRAGTFPDWVLNHIQQKKKMSTADYRKAVGRNIKTLIRTGTTSVGEISTHGASPAALEQSGLRAIVFHELITMSRGSVLPSLFADVQRGSDTLVRRGISPHTPYTVSETALSLVTQAARKKHLPLCMHVAESKDEIRLLRRMPSRLRKIYDLAGWDIDWAPVADSPFAYLNGLGILGPGFIAVHAVQAGPRDIAILERTGAAVVHCPRSNRELGVGRMPLKKFLDAGIRVGLGTDSLASSPSLSMWDEMRFAHRIHRRDGVTAEDIFRLATTGGAQALGIGKETGSITKGKKADLIAVPLPSRNTGNLFSDLLRETETCIMSMVNGKILFSRR